MYPWRMLPWVTLDETRTADGTVLTLARRGGEWEVCANGLVLMSNRTHGSEDELARLAFAKAPHAKTVLIGGLGLGFSLRVDPESPRAAREGGRGRAVVDGRRLEPFPRGRAWPAGRWKTGASRYAWATCASASSRRAAVTT